MTISYVEKGGFTMLKTENTAALIIDFQERMMPSISNHEELIRKAAVFAKGCRILDVPVLVTQQYTKGLGETMPALRDALGEFEHIEKTSFSCRGEPVFVDKLKAMNKNNVLVTGVESHICVQQTVLELLEDGWAVYVIADCIGSRSETDRAYAEQRMRQAGAVLTTTEAVLFEFMLNAGHPKRKEISNLVK